MNTINRRPHCEKSIEKCHNCGEFYNLFLMPFYDNIDGYKFSKFYCYDCIDMISKMFGAVNMAKNTNQLLNQK